MRPGVGWHGDDPRAAGGAAPGDRPGLRRDPDSRFSAPGGLTRVVGGGPSPTPTRFRAVQLDADLVLTPDNGTARITQDELGSTCDRVGGPFSNCTP